MEQQQYIVIYAYFFMEITYTVAIYDMLITNGTISIHIVFAQMYQDIHSLDHFITNGQHEGHTIMSNTS